MLSDETKAFLETHGKRPVTYQFLFDVVVPAIRESCETHRQAKGPSAAPPDVDELRRQVAELAQHMTHLKEFAWKGVWSANATYMRGNFVTWGGGIWHSDVNHNRGAKPGQAPTSWTLAVKRGADGRDGANAK